MVKRQKTTGNTMVKRQKTKRQTIVRKKLKTEPQEPQLKQGVNSGVPEGEDFLLH
jgi:hypothetical protein